MRQCESPGLNPEAAKEQAKRREFWEEPTSLRKGLGGGALEAGLPGKGRPHGSSLYGREVGGREEARPRQRAGFQIPNLEGTRRGLRWFSPRLPLSEPRRRRQRRWRRRISSHTGRACCPAEVAAAISSRPGPWAPCATRVMRTEAEAAGQPLEPGQCLSNGPCPHRGNRGWDSALELGRVWPLDLGPSAASAWRGSFWWTLAR